MEGRFSGTVDKKMRSDATMVGITVVVHAARYLGVLDSSPGLEAIIIAGYLKDLSL